MKFSLFIHMERTFSQTPQKTNINLYQDMLALCKIADEGGMQTIWTGEHHAMDFTIAPNPFLNLIDRAHHTKNIRLGTATIIAPFWHPIKLAGEAAICDILTQGRLELGIARGAYSYEYERLMPGMDAWQAGERMRELIPTLQALWQGDYAHQGKYYPFPSTSTTPKPLQEHGPPLWVAARDPNSHEFALAHNCNIQVTPLWHGDEEITSLMAHFKAAKAKVAPVNANAKIMLLHHCFVGETQNEIDQAALELSYFYCNFGAWFMNKRPVIQGQIAPMSAQEMAQMNMYSPDVMKANMAIGTAKTVINRLKHYENLGYDEYALWIDSGMSFEKKKANLTRFIDSVMPAFS